MAGRLVGNVLFILILISVIFFVFLATGTIANGSGAAEYGPFVVHHATFGASNGEVYAFGRILVVFRNDNMVFPSPGFTSRFLLVVSAALLAALAIICTSLGWWKQGFQRNQFHGSARTGLALGACISCFMPFTVALVSRLGFTRSSDLESNGTLNTNRGLIVFLILGIAFMALLTYATAGWRDDAYSNLSWRAKVIVLVFVAPGLIAGFVAGGLLVFIIAGVALGLGGLVLALPFIEAQNRRYELRQDVERAVRRALDD